MIKDKRAWSAEAFFRKLVTHGEKEDLIHLRIRRRAHSTWVIFRDSSCAGTGCPWSGISYLAVGVAAKARELLGRLVSGNESDAPQITTAEDWHVGFAPGPGDDLADLPRHKPDYCLNVGITWPGLVALEVKDRVPTLSFKSFGAFIAGAAARANLVGDTGASAPQNWIAAFRSANDHVMVTLHAMSPEAMTAYSDRLSALFTEGGRLSGDLAYRRDTRGCRWSTASPNPAPRFPLGTPTASA